MSDHHVQPRTDLERPRIAGSTAADDKPEGLEEASSWVDYPIDDMLIRTENRTIFDVIRRIDQGNFIMNPEFQRGFVWNEAKQSKLVESVIMRIPLPVFYLAEDEQGRMIVVDGLQRLSTFDRFIKDKLRLKMPGRPELHGKRFSDLRAKLQNRFEDCNLILYSIDSKVPERARLDIFERVNGGEPLTRQQMRNSLYMGPGTEFLRKEAEKDLFIRATGRSLDWKTMRDREFVNRYCAFELLGVDEYRGDMDRFLADCLKKMNRMDAGELSRLSEQFARGLKNNEIAFGKHAFRKPGKEGRRSVINAAIWDVMSTGLARYETNLVRTWKSKLKQSFLQLMEDETFNKAVSISTGSTRRVQVRFEKTRRLLQETLGDFTY